jgi:2-polyprenyl-3-methyl-5-hydroxy-6-metoxy-1,4-benzoquinol methylase
VVDSRFVTETTLLVTPADGNLGLVGGDERLIAEQIEYYRSQAAEYDETSRPPDDSLGDFGSELTRALDAFRPTGNVLEIASGTGAWTTQLLRHASLVTALDASPEMHDQAAVKINRDPRVRFILGDVFSWEPDTQYDVVFFANWLSHVPPKRFERFWATVGNALRASGRVFFIDELLDAWRQEHLSEEFIGDADAPVVHRSLRDGRRFRVVKVFWDPEELESKLRELGWHTEVHQAGPFFWAEGRRLDRPDSAT